MDINQKPRSLKGSFDNLFGIIQVLKPSYTSRSKWNTKSDFQSNIDAHIKILYTSNKHFAIDQNTTYSYKEIMNILYRLVKYICISKLYTIIKSLISS